MAHKNLENKEGIDKLKELAKSADICMFATHYNYDSLAARPMSTQDVDDEGVFWFFSQASSNLNAAIGSDNRVQLFYSNLSSFEFMSLYGKATIIKDDAKAKELWSSIAKTWFKEGYDDPELTLIKFDPDDGYYWDTKDGKLISLIKMVAGAISGKELNSGIEGRIKV